MIIDKDKFPTEVDQIVHSVHDGKNLLHLVHIPLVRCKDCKYNGRDEDVEWSPEDIACEYWAIDGLEADDFCSKGVKR